MSESSSTYGTIHYIIEDVNAEYKSRFCIKLYILYRSSTWSKIFLKTARYVSAPKAEL